MANTTSNTYSRWLVRVSWVLGASLIPLYLLQQHSVIGPIAIIALALLAIGTNGYDKVKSLSYTLWILTAVTAAMFYPQYFLKIGDYTLSSAIVPLLQIIMFGMGTTMSLQDFMGVVKMPKGVIIGVLCQFTIMPLVGTGLAYLFQFPPEIAAGIILVGTSPSGLASNVMTYIAKANVALSVTLTAVATLLAPLVTPLLMQLLAGQYIPVDFWAMMFSIFKIVIIPIAAGLLFNGLLEKPYSWQQRHSIGLVVLIGLGLVMASYFMYSYFSQLLSFVLGSSETLSTVNNLIWIALLAAGAAIILQKTVPRPERINQWMPFVSMLAIAAIIVVVTAVGRNDLMKVGALLIIACFLHNILGYVLGYWSCRALRMDEKSCRTIAIEVGLQNAGLASGIAKEIGMLATVGLAPAVFGPLMNITGSSLASWWRDR